MTYGLPAIGEATWGQKILDSIEACRTVITITEFGAAVGNSAAANQTSIQNALTAAGVSGGTVYVPPGTFLHNDAFTIPSNVHLRGSGLFSILKATSLVNGGAGIGHRQLDATSKTGFRVSDLMLDASEMTVFSSGMRSILCQSSTNYSIDRVFFRTPGAAVASIGCSEYTIDRPYVDIIATDGVAHHDGIIDQWGGSHDFTILHPVIKGNGIGKYGVLVTGETTAGVAAACYNFTVVKPRVFSVKQAGVLSNGRKGVNHDFTIDQPYVDGVELYHGVGIADSTDWTLVAPQTKNTGANGVRIYSETSLGGVTGGRNGVVTAPVVKNANVALSASGTDGAAIVVTDNSDGVVVANPRVSGTNHTYAVTFGTSVTNATYVEGRLVAGSLGKVSGDPNGGTYTPATTAVANVTAASAAICRWARRGDVVTVHGRISVTPTAGASTVTTVGIALPVASNLASATNDLSGSGSTKTGISCGISADITNDRAELEFLSPGTTALLIPFSFSYTVL